MEAEMTPNRKKSTSKVIITPNFKLYYRTIVNNKSHGIVTKQACIAKGWKQRTICVLQIVRNLKSGEGGKNITLEARVILTNGTQKTR